MTNKTVEERIVTKFNTRKLLTKDVFTVVRIINAMGIKDEIKNMRNIRKVKGNEEEVGALFGYVLLKGLENEDNEAMIYDFLGDVAHMNPDEIKNQEIEGTIDLFLQISKENNLQHFFKSAQSIA